jgi:hypothetical protein
MTTVANAIPRRLKPRVRVKPMTILVLNSETAKTSIGELLSGARDPQIQIRDECGRVLATVVLAPESDAASRHAARALSAADRAEIRRRRATDHADDLTTAELLDQLNASNAG